MNSCDREQSLVADQAAEWMSRLKSDGPDVHARLVDWLRESPLHMQEFFLASGVDDVLQRLDPERKVDIDALIARAHANSKVVQIKSRLSLVSRRIESRKNVRSLATLAASLTAIALLGVAGWITYLHPSNEKTYATELGGQRTFKLNDGSVVVLNTLSRIQVRYSKATRDIYLDQGQALFQVYHDVTRPFRVHSGEAVVQAIGTQFDVRRFADRTMVAVVEGTVQVSSIIPQASSQEETVEFSNGAARITAGEGVTVDVGGEIERTEHIDAAAATAWRQQRLFFVDKPLSEIASEFNLYNANPQLRVADDELKSRVFTGSFNAYSPESFVAYLSQQTDLLAERRGEEVVVRLRLAGTSRSN